MIEARIASPRGSLYIATEATPYDLQLLRWHVRALATGDARDLCLTLRIGPTTRPRVADLAVALAKSLANEGLDITLDDEKLVPSAVVRASAPTTHLHDVMLIEDDRDSREALSTALEMYGSHVRKAIDGQDALDQLHAGYRPCAILLDLRMPRMDGWMFRDKQRRDPELGHIPVALLTAVENMRLEARRLDIDTAFSKPTNLHAVLEFIEQHIQP